MGPMWEATALDQERDDLSVDRSHLDRLLTEHRNQIYHYIFSLVPNDVDADDICQRCSIVMWRKFAEFDRDRSFLAWACGIAHYEIQNFRRSAGAGRMVFSSDVVQSLATQLEHLDGHTTADRLTALQSCLKHLPARDRLLVHEVYWNGRNYEEVAQHCGFSLRTAYNRMHLIRRRLLDCIARKHQARQAAGD